MFSKVRLAFGVDPLKADALNTAQHRRSTGTNNSKRQARRWEASGLSAGRRRRKEARKASRCVSFAHRT